MKYRLRLSYNGSAFSGWQIQPNAPSVQECIQNVLSILLNEEITVTGAGRTDTKVNAINYVAHFVTTSPEAVKTGWLCYKLNAMLPKGIVIHEVVCADENFHSRFDATSREYKYFLHKKKDPFVEQFSYFCPFNLDIDAMNKAALFLLGTHDFRCFEKIGGNNKTSICTITEAKWENWTPDHVKIMGYPYSGGDYLMFTVKADRFLRNMVRAIVGTMLDVGRGKHSPEWVQELIETGTRSDAGQSVPGHALFLSNVEYDDCRDAATP